MHVQYLSACIICSSVCVWVYSLSLLSLWCSSLFDMAAALNGMPCCRHDCMLYLCSPIMRPEPYGVVMHPTEQQSFSTGSLCDSLWCGCWTWCWSSWSYYSSIIINSYLWTLLMHPWLLRLPILRIVIPYNYFTGVHCTWMQLLQQRWRQQSLQCLVSKPPHYYRGSGWFCLDGGNLASPTVVCVNWCKIIRPQLQW